MSLKKLQPTCLQHNITQLYIYMYICLNVNAMIADRVELKLNRHINLLTQV